MTELHETPADVAAAVAQWVPEGIAEILDPAVGNGALIRPLATRTNLKRIVAYDLDDNAVARSASALGDAWSGKFEVHKADYLESYVPKGRAGYDCIVMNPPFAGRRSLARGTQRWWPESIGSTMPIESAFVAKAMHELRAGGRLVALLPGSVISGLDGSGLRLELLRKGRIAAVHELPPFTFKRVEARVYLLVLDKCGPFSSVPLMNHSLTSPERIHLFTSELDTSLRLDYAFYEARAVYRTWLKNTWGWTRVADVFEVARGKNSGTTGLHTTDYRQGRWSVRPFLKESNVTAKAGDILVSRVGRNPLEKVGIHQGPSSPISDCLLRMRPHVSADFHQKLFAFLAVVCSRRLRPLWVRGTGAAFVRVGELSNAEIPLCLPEAYPEHYADFFAAIESDQWSAVRDVMEDLACILP